MIRRSPKKTEAKVMDGGERIFPRKNTLRKDVRVSPNQMNGKKPLARDYPNKPLSQQKRQSGQAHQLSIVQTNKT